MRQIHLAPLLLLPLLLALPAPTAQAGASKTFKEHGFAWTMPSDEWQFSPTSAEDVSAGFVAKAECTAASIEVIVYAKPTGGLSLDERVGELRDAGGDGLGDATRTVVADTTLSGVAGKVVIQKIRADGGTEGHFRKYVIIADGRFYQLLIRCWYGAHETAKEEVNGIRQGFRLLSGAGGPDKDESLEEIPSGGEPGADGADGASGGSRPSAGGGEVDPDKAGSGDWPPNGPKRNGRTVEVTGHNLEWTLPEDDSWTWAAAIEDVKAESGQFLIARAKIAREKKEFEKDTPDFQQGTFDVLIQPAQPGFKPDTWVKSGDAQQEVEKNWKYFEQIESGKTRTDESVKLGNHTGAYLKLEGTSKRHGAPAVLMLFATQLGAELYVFRAFCWGHTDVFKQMAPIVAGALKGVKFLDTREPQAGPLLSIIPDFAGKRGADLGVEKDYGGLGFKFTKPASMVRVQPGGQELSMNRDFAHAFEGRTEDGEAYLYFEIRTYKLNISNTPNPDEEKLLDGRAQAWLAGAGEGASVGGKDGKVKFKGGSFNGAKGITYEFTGMLKEVPFTEEGWLVKHKNALLWIRAQFGGPVVKGQDAAKRLKDLWKDVRKGLKLSK